MRDVEVNLSWVLPREERRGEMEEVYSFNGKEELSRAE